MSTRKTTNKKLTPCAVGVAHVLSASNYLAAIRLALVSAIHKLFNGVTPKLKTQSNASSSAAAKLFRFT